MAGLARARASDRRIAITQRRVAAAATIGEHDQLDAAWSGWFAAELPESQFLAVPNTRAVCQTVSDLVDWGANALLLSGGEDVGSSPVRDAQEIALLKEARVRDWPVIGICRGMQLLHRVTGGVLVEVVDHVGVEHAVRSGHAVMTVNSWHRWGVMEAGAGWTVLASAADGSIEAMLHRKRPWLGLMWHPERSAAGADAARAWIQGVLAHADLGAGA